MIVCPVCDHQQAQGAECDVCGKRLVPGLSEADLRIPFVEGLEPTLQPPVDASGDQVPDLEPTLRAADDGPILPDPTPGIEATHAAPVDVAVEPTPDVERTATEIPGDAPTALPAFVTCRYCRTPAMPGERICGRCGMRLPAMAGAEGATESPEALRICSCGAPLRPGAALCPNCGARLG